MTNKVYEIRVVSDSIEKEKDKQGIKKGPKPSNDIVAKGQEKPNSKVNKEAVSAIGAGVGYALMASDLIGSYQQTNYAISGDSIGARNQAQNQKILHTGINLGTNLMAGFAIGGFAGVGAVAISQAVGVGLKAIKHQETMRRYEADRQIENIQKNYIRDRLSASSSEVRR